MPSKRGTKRDKSGRLTPQNPSQDVPMRIFIENVPPDELTAALEASPDPKFQQFLDARTDPAYRNHSFAAICRKLNITLSEFDDLWRNHQLHRAMIRVSNYTPEIFEGVARAARSKMEACSRCDGEKLVYNDRGVGRTCPVCDGAGKVEVYGVPHAIDKIYGSMGMDGRKGGPMVAIQQNFGLDSSLEDVLIESHKLLNSGDKER